MQITPSIHTIDGVVSPPGGWGLPNRTRKQTSTKFHHARYSSYRPSLLIDDGDLTLFDVGTPNCVPAIRAYVENLGFTLSDIKNVIVSEANVDHIASLKELVDITGAKTYAHEVEIPYLLKQAFHEGDTRDFEVANIDVALKDGEVLDILGGIEVIHTPGHTPGHIALRSAREKTLLAADLLRYSRGAFHLCPPQYSVSYPDIARSMVKVAKYDFENLVPYHGEALIGGADVLYRENVEYLKAISDILLPEIREALEPDLEGGLNP